MKKQVLILTTLLISIIGYSQTFIQNNVTYTVTSTNQVGVSDYNMNGGTDVVIPASITVGISGKSSGKSTTINNTTYNVTSIENNAFSNTPITSVIIPNTVTNIKAGAFYNSRIASVIISENVTNIGSNAFAGNAYLSCVTSLSTTPPTLTVNSSSHSFGLIRNNITLKIPSGTWSVYAHPNNGAQWTGFSNGGNPYEVDDFFVANFIKYKITSITNNTVVVSGHIASIGNTVDIPTSVSDCTSTYTVTEIGTTAFANNGNITNITIPNTITSIGQSAFNNCNLTSVSIPSSVTIIKQAAFSNNSISNLIINNGVTTIENFAFSTNQLTAINLPESITSVGNGVFRVNTALTKVFSSATTPPTITTANSSDDTFANRNNIHLYIPVGTKDVYVTNSGALWTGFNPVSEIFVDNFITYEVTSTSPNTVKAIDYNTDGGTSVAIPNTVTYASSTYAVTEIDDFAFYGNSLNAVTIDDGVSTIGKNAFKNNSIATIVIPNSVTDIDENAFENNQLETVTLSTGLTEIKSFVFQNNLMNSLTIPNNIFIIQKNAFLNNQLTSLTIPSSVIVIYQRAFMDNQLTSLTLENGISTIYYEVFRNNQLTSLIIPSSVNNIGNATFINNPLTSITSIKATAPNINTDATYDTFAADRSGIDLIIPSGSMASYVTDLNAKWTGFNTVSEDPSLSTSNFKLPNSVKIILVDDKIKLIFPNSIKLQSYTLYNISGMQVFKGTKNEISTNSLRTGIYILKLDSDKGTFVKKVLVD